jgi:hypothetical protein
MPQLCYLTPLNFAMLRAGEEHPEFQNDRTHIPASRWAEYRPPTFAAVVKVATTEDVQETVRWLLPWVADH